MALTQQQWYEKLRSWVPEWFFEEEYYNKAVFQGFAEVFSNLEEVTDGHFNESFILQAVGDYLDEHGKERGLVRGVGETDAAYRVRIQNITNTTNIPALDQAIEDIVMFGCALVVDNEVIQPFYNREHFYDRHEIATPYVKNFFTIWINPQLEPSREYFFDREFFNDRESFYSAFPRTELDYIYEAIVQLVEKNKALGTMYQIVLTDAELCT